MCNFCCIGWASFYQRQTCKAFELAALWQSSCEGLKPCAPQYHGPPWQSLAFAAESLYSARKPSSLIRLVISCITLWIHLGCQHLLAPSMQHVLLQNSSAIQAYATAHIAPKTPGPTRDCKPKSHSTNISSEYIGALMRYACAINVSLSKTKLCLFDLSIGCQRMV